MPPGKSVLPIEPLNKTSPGTDPPGYRRCTSICTDLWDRFVGGESNAGPFPKLSGITQKDYSNIETFVTPNPVLMIGVLEYFPNNSGSYKITVYDSKGTKIKEETQNVATLTSHKLVLNQKDMASGNYLYTIEYEGKKLGTGSFVVSK